ncbi:kinase-like domain-containing protein [Cubamyces menziesii]|uniref:Protein kinase domain-containing protein n=1 Tax=Trametes cubensis TaxID=1111947 RepID=A0AAD7X6K4_9APHY|nr:kinase-like domain-containing protein [Cubamyces menziesii]KAJ8454863.1 hypothetical protein ONZ51_g12780 [Trametes cubensis]
MKMKIWKTLCHPHVLELYGASSTSGNPPWFFVSPYLSHGSLVSYLQHLPTLPFDYILQVLHQIAEGMEYLHSKDVLHGDLKASNVLVNDTKECVLADFGMSEMKSEVLRISGITLQGTYRWMAPELMRVGGELTKETDVYAFAITVIEVLTKGETIPWGSQLPNADMANGQD